jgi:hypothetical protein
MPEATITAPEGGICTETAQRWKCPDCGNTFKVHRGGGLIAHQKACKADWSVRFWAKVRRGEGCWEWTGARHKQGYGAFGILGKYHRSSRVAYELVNGPIPAGQDVLHKCDNPPCCNPEHLFLGDDAANSKDAMAKRRHAHGETNTHAKLTEEQVLEIRRRYRYTGPRGKTNVAELAKEYGVAKVTLYAAASRRSWKHLP